jgi:hypothetical protein
MQAVSTLNPKKPGIFLEERMTTEGEDEDVEVNVRCCPALARMKLMIHDVETGEASVQGWGLGGPQSTTIGYARHQCLGDMVRGDIPYNILLVHMRGPQ